MKRSPFAESVQKAMREKRLSLRAVTKGSYFSDHPGRGLPFRLSRAFIII